MFASYKFALAAFFVLSLLNLLGIAIQSEVIIYLTKPLLVASLALWFWIQTKDRTLPFRTLYMLGMAFSTIGDILLLLVGRFGEIYFLLGLISFLAAHLSYIASFFTYPGEQKGVISKNWLLAIPYGLTFLCIALFFHGSLGAYEIPVLTYAFVIVSMSAFSLNMLGRISKDAAKYLVLGSLLFMASDLTIALKKFKYPALDEILSSLAIMSSYLIGQYCMAKGMVKSMMSSEGKKS